MIKFRCSHCNKKLGVPDDYAGRRIRCNTCDHHTMVPNQPKTEGQITQKTGDSYHFPQSKNENLSPRDRKSSIDQGAAAANNDELITAETLLNTPKSADVDIQLQSFHHFTPSDSVIAGPVSKAAPKSTVSELLKRCRPDPATDRTELALNTLSLFSCIGPVLFIAMFFYILMAMAVGDSPRAMAAHHASPAEPNAVSTADPNTLSTHNPFSALPASAAVRYSFYVFGLGVSPLAMIASLVLVFRYSYDMPKSLYFSIVIHGLIFFTIFRG